MMKIGIAFVLASTIVFGCGGSQSASTNSPTTMSAAFPKGVDTDAKITWALSDPLRDANAKKRDVYRHPRETLTFFGLKDNMHVIELWPGSGWYTEILAPILAEHGQLTVTDAPNKKIASHPETFGHLDIKSASPNNINLGPDESADMVVTFRNMHNWVGAHIEGQMLAAVFKVLKHGGVFGMTDHRAKADADPSKAGDTGYLREDWAIKTVEAAGFKLAEKSEINANPKDTKDYPGGVWNLPPVLRAGATDRAKYEAIGESDRMTLKFIKP
jgi:predicted methyltransferase